MANIVAVLARVIVDDLDLALPLYQRLAGTDDVKRFRFGAVELASVGPFLLLSGATAAYADRVATLLVQDLAPVVADITKAGGTLIDGPSAGPNGDRLIARDPDGAVFEYIRVPAQR